LEKPQLFTVGQWKSTQECSEVLDLGSAPNGQIHSPLLVESGPYHCVAGRGEMERQPFLSGFCCCQSS